MLKTSQSGVHILELGHVSYYDDIKIIFTKLTPEDLNISSVEANLKSFK